MASVAILSDNEKKRKMCDETTHVAKRAPKGFWTPNEDMALFALMQARNVASICWQEVANHLPGRTSKQCRERWNEHLNPSVDHTAFTEEEDAIILQAQMQLGNKWKDITKMLPHSHRTSSSIKVRWHHLQRRLASLHKLESSLSALTHIHDHVTSTSTSPNHNEVVAVTMTDNAATAVPTTFVKQESTATDIEFDFTDDDISLIEAMDCCSSSTTTTTSYADYSSDDYFFHHDDC